MLINCNAKINIALEILNKRKDNFHNINTIFQKICIADRLTIEKSNNFEFIFNSDLVLPNEENLAFRATEIFRKIYHYDNLPVRIILDKRIPAGAGLGGGSTDAANVLKGLIKFFDLPFDNEKLFSLATELGSDIPFFLLDETSAVANGRGEILNAFNMQLPYYLLLVMPDIHISTAKAYQLLNRDSTKKYGTDFSSVKNIIIDEPQKMKDIFKNDFEAVVFDEYPELAEIKKQLYDVEAFFASMSGTGSAIYGMFEEEQLLKAAVENFSHYRIEICQPV